MEHRRYRSELLASSLLKIPYTNEDTSSLISIVLTRKKPTTYFERYMKEFAVTTRKQGLFTGKALKAGYYWPTLQKDIYELIKAYDQCQHFMNI